MKYAIGLSHDQDSLELDLNGYSVTIPNSEAGMNILFRVLRAKITLRAQVKNQIPCINTEARPTQSMINEWLLENKPSRSTVPLPADIMEIDLEEFGL